MYQVAAIASRLGTALHARTSCSWNPGPLWARRSQSNSQQTYEPRNYLKYAGSSEPNRPKCGLLGDLTVCIRQANTYDARRALSRTEPA